jgi:hypothetical protein
MSSGIGSSLALLCCLFVAGCNSLPAALPTNSALGQEADRPSVRRGFYVSGGVDVLGYHNPKKRNGPICKLKGLLSVNDVGIDFNGDLIVPDANNSFIDVYRGPGLCGPLIGSFREPYGNPVDAASADAINGTIFVADIGVAGAPRGSILRCTLAKGCDTRLTNPKMVAVFALAVARDGDCWALGTSNGFEPRLNLTYFKKCLGGGQQATGFKAEFVGNLDIDSAGNLVVIYRCCVFLHPKTTVVRIYKGCNPRCKHAGGPFSTDRGGAYCGHLNENSTELAIANPATQEVDIYKYSTAALTFLYSFDTPVKTLINCVAVLPRSSE